MVTEQMIHEADLINHVDCYKCGVEIHVEEAYKFPVVYGLEDIDYEPVCADCAEEAQIKFDERGY